MKTEVKMSNQLAEILEEASSEVETWPHWQRSLDPQGDELDSSAQDIKSDSDAEESAA